jgi:hypothetical protein
MTCKCNCITAGQYALLLIPITIGCNFFGYYYFHTSANNMAVFNAFLMLQIVLLLLIEVSGIHTKLRLSK